MRTIETEITIQGTPERVWSVLTGFADYPQWNPFVREISGSPTEGERLRVRIEPPGGSAMTFTPMVKVASAGRELRWLGNLLVPGLFDGEHRFEIEARGDGTVRFRQAEEFRGLLVPLLPSAMYEKTARGFDAMNRALKERVERP
jgi:hypothetical protein